MQQQFFDREVHYVANETIRKAAKQAGVKLWEVAECFGVADSTFSRQMRRELPIDKQEKALATIRAIAAQREEE